MTLPPDILNGFKQIRKPIGNQVPARLDHLGQERDVVLIRGIVDKPAKRDPEEREREKAHNHPDDETYHTGIIAASRVAGRGYWV